MNQSDYDREMWVELGRLCALNVGELYDSAQGGAGQRFKRALEALAATIVEMRKAEMKEAA